MSVLAWWLIPLVATLSAIVVISVANRPRGPGPSDRSVEEFQRFRTALEQQTQGKPQVKRRVVASDDQQDARQRPDMRPDTRPDMGPGSEG